uniref:Plexin_cytopl domain-containing protein n=1 Tax=Gongylonema pulchrum TaxID=637853 RepID=A0A183EC46_9BILA
LPTRPSLTLNGPKDAEVIAQLRNYYQLAAQQYRAVFETLEQNGKPDV